MTIPHLCCVLESPDIEKISSCPRPKHLVYRSCRDHGPGLAWVRESQSGRGEANRWAYGPRPLNSLLETLVRGNSG